MNNAALVNQDRGGADVSGDNSVRLELRALRGEYGATENLGGSYVVDSRALSRWKLEQARLPSGTELLFAPASIWKLCLVPSG